MKAVYFAWVRERVGKAEEELEPPSTVTTVGDLIAWLSAAGRRLRPCLREAVERPRGARSGPRAARGGDRRREGSRLLSADDRRLSRWRRSACSARISTPARRRQRSRAGARDVGAVVSFVGYCRDEGGRLAALELEHYPGMAEEEIARVAREAEARWPLIGVTAIHRTGRIAPGEQIVLVAVVGRASRARRSRRPKC